MAGFVATAMFLAGCATPTPYQPDEPGHRIAGGFSEERLAGDRYRVTFSGNCFTSRERVERYLLYRAAELTLEKNYDWFSIVDRLTERDVQTYREPASAPARIATYAYWQPYWRYYDPAYGWRWWDPYGGTPFWAERVTVRTVESYRAHAEIVMHAGTAPESDQRAFVAREIVAELEPAIERPAHKGTC